MKKFDDRWIKPLFLGPKAENVELFEKLLALCFRDHCFWRRNFHPEDRSWISEADHQSTPFLDTGAVLQDKLNNLLSELKRGVPTYHRRYLGHMHTDLSMAAILGQFASLFYSQNNVVSEASPVTTRLELEAVRRLASMIGFATSGTAGAWGHLCSGGTVANIEAIWAARAVRHMPVSLILGTHRLAAGDESERLLAEELFAIRVDRRGSAAQLSSLSTIDLLNLTPMTIFELRIKVADVLRRATDLASGTDAKSRKERGKVDPRRRADALMRGFGPEEVSRDEVNVALLKVGLRPLSDHPWLVYVSTTKHYSFDKIVDILGLGRRSLHLIPIAGDFGLDVQQLEQALVADVMPAIRSGEGGPLPLAVIAVVGSTEEGAVDDLPALVSVRDRLRPDGLEFWLHADAAYGGYAASMLRTRERDRTPPSAQLFFTELAGEDLTRDPLVAGWARSLDRLSAMAGCDSVTIDPHKMGLLPYPAGAVLFRDGRSKFGVSCEAPYLFEGEEIDAFAGRYTLEGSRPGHVAAGIHLAHEVLPLDQQGHGAMIGLSFLGARDLYLRMQEEPTKVDPKVRVRFLMLPSLNILNYIVCHDDVVTLVDQNLLTKLILVEFSSDANRLRPIADFQFFVVSTSLPLAKYRGFFETFLPSCGISPTREEWETGELKIFRSVVMHPNMAEARTRAGDSEVSLAFAFARLLASVCRDQATKIPALRARDVVESLGRPLGILIVEDKAEQRNVIRGALAEFLPGDFQPRFAASRDAARQTIENAKQSGDLLDLLIADLNLEGDDHVSALKASGPDVISCFRSAFPNGRVLVLSVFRGMSQEERLTIPGDALCDKADCFFKPEGRELLVRKVVELVRSIPDIVGLP